MNTPMRRLDPQSTSSVHVTSGTYSNGVLLLSESFSDQRATKLLAVGRDLSAPPLGPMHGLYMMPGQFSSLRESVVELEDCHIPGDAMAIVPVPSDSLWGERYVENLSTQHLQPRQQFVLVSTTGVLELERRRPVDILQVLLEDRATERVEEFFRVYGPGESAAMCLMLIISPIGSVPTAVSQMAQQVFESQHFTGEPMMSDSGVSGYGQDSSAGAFNMGRPVLEPQFKSSGAHEGLCLFVARLVRPVWEKQILVPTKGSPGFVQCPFSVLQLESLEQSLRGLQKYLASYLKRRPSRSSSRGGYAEGRGLWSARENQAVAGGVMWDTLGSGRGGLEDGDAQAKRRRLEDAATMEERSVRLVRACVGRAAEGLYLLRTLLQHHVGRLVARLPDAIKAQVTTLSFRELVCGAHGEEAASHLISALVSEHIAAAGGVSDDLAARLSSGCPSYFKEEDRVFYKASGLLQQAESSDPERAAGLTQEALRMLMQVPGACSLGQVVPQLSHLGCYEGVVNLPIKAAGALDPGNMAARPGTEGDNARARRETCYSHTISVLRFLVSSDDSDKENRMTEEQRLKNKKALLKAAMRSEDTFFLEVLFREMIALGLGADLLQLDSKAARHLEAYLRKAGGLAGASPGMALAPLGASQVEHLELLAKVYVSLGSFGSAAQVHMALAERRNGPGEMSVSLERRCRHFEEAALQAKSHGDVGLIDDIDAKLTISRFQKRIAERLYSGASEHRLQPKQLEELREGPKGISELFNDYARQAEMWDLCLEIVGFSMQDLDSSGVVAGLWDWYLLQGVRQAQRGSDLEEACSRVEALGVKLSTSDQAFPMEHVLLRLHQLAIGAWPEDSEGVQQDQPRHSEQRIATAAVQAAKGSTDKVRRAYDDLLRRREGDPFGRELQRSDMRLQILQSLLQVVMRAKIGIQERYEGGDLSARLSWSREAREAGQLAEACERYSGQAARLHGIGSAPAEHVSSSFKELQGELEAIVARYR
mmetsp:Transcript_20731/g.49379  ORF Transcript_20731/g.49379 Transcript_20731/m.49379 type:complete len:994 (-) Transcript_20731:270-3251(-)